jgi:cytochrome d ubiquinol oxidase subunit II
MSYDTLTIVWFFLLGVLLIGYAILDGFDLGVGIIHPFVAKGDQQRRITMNSIGPLWDGNEVWLVTFGGALFAAFPNAYATVFSGFYSAFMLLLFALIFRAVSLEFRSKVHNRIWRSIWDWCFFGASGVASLLFGVAGGNLIAGLAIGEGGDYTGTMLNQLWSPTAGAYPLVVGLMTVALFAMHGGIYLYLKTEGELQERAHKSMWTLFGVFLTLYIFATMYTLQAVPNATRNFEAHPWLWIVPVLNVLAIANIVLFQQLCDDRSAGDSLCRGDLPELRRLNDRRGQLGQHLERPLEREDPRHHADHRDHRHPVRALVHGGDLLDVPRQGDARPIQLLSPMYDIVNISELKQIPVTNTNSEPDFLCPCCSNSQTRIIRVCLGWM